MYKREGKIPHKYVPHLIGHDSAKTLNSIKNVVDIAIDEPGGILTVRVFSSPGKAAVFRVNNGRMSQTITKCKVAKDGIAVNTTVVDYDADGDSVTSYDAQVENWPAGLDGCHQEELRTARGTKKESSVDADRDGQGWLQ